MLDNLRTSLNQAGLSGTLISAADENSPDAALSAWNGYSSTTKSYVNKINTHSYEGINPYRGVGRGALNQAAASAGKKLWASEYGDNDAAGMTLAETILLDMRNLRPCAWVYWKAVEPYSGCGMLNADYATGTLSTINRKYYVYGQFARYIRPGCRIIDINDHNSIAAYDAAGRKLVIVTQNWGNGQYVSYNLSKFSSIGTTFQRRATTTAPGGGIPDWKWYSDGAWNMNDYPNKTFWSYFYPNRVQTFVIDNVYM